MWAESWLKAARDAICRKWMVSFESIFSIMSIRVCFLFLFFLERLLGIDSSLFLFSFGAWQLQFSGRKIRSHIYYMQQNLPPKSIIKKKYRKKACRQNICHCWAKRISVWYLWCKNMQTDHLWLTEILGDCTGIFFFMYQLACFL